MQQMYTSRKMMKNCNGIEIVWLEILQQTRYEKVECACVVVKWWWKALSFLVQG